MRQKGLADRRDPLSRPRVSARGLLYTLLQKRLTASALGARHDLV